MIKRFGLFIGALLLLGGIACFGIFEIRFITPEATTYSVPATQASDPAEEIASAVQTPEALQRVVPQQEGIPSRIVAESIQLDAPIVEMGWRREEEETVWDIPTKEAGWHRNSARPGKGSNVVISGHNNSTGGRVFGNLDELARGDQITLWTGDEISYTYQIDKKHRIRTFAASQETLDYLNSFMEPTSEEQLTLITCWPSWSNTHRIILVAYPL